MEIIVAKSAGFCFGVNKAVSLTYELIDKKEKRVFTLGPIIHNEQVVADLEEKGVPVIENVDNVGAGDNIVIRAHGVIPQTYEKIQASGARFFDATCPYVKKIHKLVEQKYKEGYKIIIVGDKKHPEVIGINGWCNNEAMILETEEEALVLPESEEKVCVVAQTTITKEKWEKINKSLKNKFKNVIKFDTICSATSERQEEAAKIAKDVDMLFVIGGKNSSNTQKLYDICKKYCENTFKVETFGDIPPVDIKKIKKIGITAGASTPDWVIEEVYNKMSELNTVDNEMDMKEAYESSFVTLKSGTTVKGRIISYNNAEIFVDLGYKSDGIISSGEYSDDPDFRPEGNVKVGEEIEVLVLRVNDGEGNVQLSKKRVDSIRSFDKILEAYENKTQVTGKVVEVVNGGVIVSVGGVRVFVPASQISDRYVKDLSEFMRKTVNLRLIEYNEKKRKLVGSVRVLLEEEKNQAASTIWSSIEEGKKYTGTVKSLMDFGAFVDIGGVDGLVHISELAWSKVKHPSEVLKVGDTVEVYILSFDKDKKKISLGYKKKEDNPWNIAAAKYAINDIVKGKVVRMTNFGAFVELEGGVDGLVHISQISNARIAKPSDVLEVGQVVEAKITELNIEAKRISLSIKEVSPIDPPSSKEEAVESSEEALPTEYKEEMPVTIGDMVDVEKK